MSQPKLLTWNPKQVMVFDLLQQGVSKADAAKQAGCSKPLVTKVANAMAKGQSPATPYIHHQTLKSLTKAQANAEAVAEGKSLATANADTKATANPETKTTPQGGDSSILLLKPVTTNCALTPIMLNARYIAITEFNWPENVSWEDFFDTCLVHLFRYWGWGLQGAYKLDDLTNGAAPKPASEKAEGTGHKQQERLEQATKVGLVVMEILKKAQPQPEH